MHRKGSTELLAQGDILARQRIARVNRDARMVARHDEQGVWVDALHLRHKVRDGLIAVPVSAQDLLLLVVVPHRLRQVLEDCVGIEAELLERHLVGTVIRGRVDVVEGRRIVIEFLDELCCMLQEDVVVDAHPCLRRVGRAELCSAHDLVKANGRAELVKVAVRGIAAVPVDGAVAQLAQLIGQCRGQCAVPEVFALVELQLRIEDARHQADDGRTRDHAGWQEVVERYRVRVLAERFGTIHDVVVAVDIVERHLRVALAHDQEDVLWLLDACALCLVHEGFGGILEVLPLAALHRIGHDGVDDWLIFLIRMAQAFLQWMLEHVLERDEVIHRRTRHKDVFLDDARDRVPLRLVVMNQRAAVAEVVKYQHHANHNCRVDGDLQGS